MKRLHFRYFVCCLLLWLSTSCLGQEIRIRVIDATSRHPLQKQRVSLSLLYEKSEKTPAKYDALVYLETDLSGEAQFRLPEPPPAHLEAQVRLTSEHWHCGCLVLVATQDLIQKGVVGTELGHRSGRSAAERAQPGEILFVARPFTFLERLLYPLVKG